MLLINRKMIRLARSSAGWIIAKVVLKLLVIISVMGVHRLISGVQGQLYSGTLTVEELKSSVVMMLAVIAVRFIGNLLDGELSYLCASKTRLTLRRRIYEKMLELEVGYSIVAGTSSAVTATVDGIEALETYFTDYLPVLLYCFIAPWIMFARMYRISPVSAWILLAASILVMPINQLFKNVVKLLCGEYWSNFSKLNAYYLECLEGLYTFKLFGIEKDRTGELKERSWTFRNSIMKTMRMNFNAATLSETVIYGSMAAAILYGSGLLESGTISFGRAIYLLLLTDTFFVPARAMLRTSHTAMNGVAAAENVFSMLNLKPVHRMPADDRSPDDRPDETGLCLENISFAYENSRNVLDNVSLRIPEGGMTAIIGESGCGKSTLAGILMRFFDPSSGSARMDGRDIYFIPAEEYRRKIAIVPQNSYVFSGTVEDNLRMAAPDATEEELWDALSKVKLDGFLRSNGHGLKTVTGEAGSMLSGGQRQKLAIARVLLSGADYLIFDESTSNVDVESEEDIWNCINSFNGERTVIVITHRLSTVEKADQIVVMDSGKVVQRGTHDTLAETDGIYSKLLREQKELEGYSEEKRS